MSADELLGDGLGVARRFDDGRFRRLSPEATFAGVILPLASGGLPFASMVGVGSVFPQPDDEGEDHQRPGGAADRTCDMGE